VSDRDLVDRYVDGFVVETEEVALLHRTTREHGLSPLSPALGATISQIARATSATRIIEVGTGVGMLTMQLAQACPDAHITTIDSELDHHLTLKELLADVEIDPAKLRLITEKAEEVLPKMNESSYDLVVIDAPAEIAGACYDAAVSVCRPGGSIAVARILDGGRVAQPTNRSEWAVAARNLLKTIEQDDRVAHAVQPRVRSIASRPELLTKRSWMNTVENPHLFERRADSCHCFGVLLCR
jgi:predicted O-methyltransferase YrrM